MQIYKDEMFLDSEKGEVYVYAMENGEYKRFFKVASNADPLRIIDDRLVSVQSLDELTQINTYDSEGKLLATFVIPEEEGVEEEENISANIEEETTDMETTGSDIETSNSDTEAEGSFDREGSIDEEKEDEFFNSGLVVPFGFTEDSCFYTRHNSTWTFEIKLDGTQRKTPIPFWGSHQYLYPEQKILLAVNEKGLSTYFVTDGDFKSYEHEKLGLQIFQVNQYLFAHNFLFALYQDKIVILNLKTKNVHEIKHKLHSLVAKALFSCGCLIKELYEGKPIQIFDFNK